MKIACVFFLTIFCCFYFFTNAGAREAVRIHNNLKDIDECKGKIHLKLIRVWGGHEEEDENKFFETPSAAAVGINQWIYICDQHNHRIKVYDSSGRFLHSLGIMGRGPGDLFAPKFIDFFRDGNLLVYEDGGRRFQWFNNQGKSKGIFKYKGVAGWVRVNSRDEIAIYDSFKTFRQRKLISIIDKKGKVLKEFGRYYDDSRNYLNSEKLKFSIDENDNVYAANMGTPVIRKYSPGGRLLMVITFETPFNIPVEINLNPEGDEIEKNEEIDKDEGVKITRKGKGVHIQSKKTRPKFGICDALAIDSENRIYLVSERRRLTEKEKEGMAVSGSVSRLNRKLVNYDIVENIDVNQLLVFDTKGKIVAQTTMTTLCDNLTIYNNRLFVIDGFFNQRVLEYEIIFNK